MSSFEVLKRILKQSIRPFIPLSYRAQCIARLNPAWYPNYVYLEPTTRCNLGCLYCGRTHWKTRDKHRDLSFELFERVVKELSEIGVKGVVLQLVGEPLMHPHILDFVARSKSLGLATVLTTNMSLLTPEIAERLVRCGHDSISVSIDSIDPAVFNDLRRGVTLDKVLENLKMLCETKRRLGTRTPHIEVNVVSMRATLAGAVDLIAEMKRIGVNSMNFQQFNTAGIKLDTVLRDGSTLRENALENMPIEQLRAEINKIKACEDENFRIGVPGISTGLKTSGPQGPGILTCAELWSTSCVDSVGRVTPCCWLPDGSIINLGDLNKQSFQEIWFGEAYDRLRRQHLTNNHPSHCRACEQLFYTVASRSTLTLNRKPPRLYTRVFIGKTPADVPK